MAGSDHPNQQPHHSARGGVEQRDVNIFAVARFGIVLFLGLIVVLFALRGLFSYFQSDLGKIAPQSRSLADLDERKLPPEPRLQPGEYTDLTKIRAAEEQVLNNYALIDPDHGLARIPIDRAMDLLAQRGLPVRPAAPSTPPNALTAAPTESGLGPAAQQAGGPLSPVIHMPPVQPLEIRGDGDFADGRQAGGPPTPPEDSPALESPGPPLQGQKK